MLFFENNLLKAGKARFFSYHTVTIANIEDEKSKLKFSPSPSPQPIHTTNPVPASVSTHQDQPLLTASAGDLPWSEKGSFGRTALVVSLGRLQWLVLRLLRVNRGTDCGDFGAQWLA